MNYIYYIGVPLAKGIDFSNERTGNYIGQGSDSLDDGKPFGRMLEHLRIAYGQHNGKPYGSELLIRERGAGGVIFGYYTAPNYGLDPKLFTALEQEGGNISKEDNVARLDAAEILHIISHNGDLSGGNVATGGQGHMVGTPKDVEGVKRFQKEGDISKLYKSKIQNVSINFHDSREVALAKLLHPDEFMVIRAASLAIEASVLHDSKFLENIIVTYYSSPSEATKQIEKKINETIDILNNKIFLETRVKPDYTNILVSTIEEKILQGAEERITTVSLSAILKKLKETFDPHNEKHLKGTIHGLPANFSKKISDKGNSDHIVASTSLHIKRSEWVSIIKGTQPTGYKNLMDHPAPPPHKSSKNDPEVFKLVEKCVYEIFESHLNECKTAEPHKPATYLKDRIKDKYLAVGAKMEYFSMFYRYAINRGEKKYSRTLKLIDQSTEEDRNLYTFEPDLTPTTGVYSWTDEFASKAIEFYDTEEIPSGTG